MSEHQVVTRPPAGSAQPQPNGELKKANGQTDRRRRKPKQRPTTPEPAPNGHLANKQEEPPPGDVNKTGWKRLPDGPLEPLRLIGARDRKKEQQGQEQQGGKIPSSEEVLSGSRKRLPDGPLEPYVRKRQHSGQDSPPAPRPRAVRIKGIPASLSYRYLKELFEKAAGTITEGELMAKTGVAQLTFECSKNAAKAVDLFSGGSLDGAEIQVELLPD